MGVDYYTCANCRDTYPDCGPTWRCEKGHGIGPCCLDDRKKYEENDDGELLATACPCCAKGGTELERTKLEIAHLRAQLAEAEKERDAYRNRECHALEVVAEYLDVLENAPDELTTDGLHGLFDAGNWSDVLSQRDAAQARVGEMEGLLRDLTAMVRGECPSLLNEDSGGDANLSLRIDAALATSPHRLAGRGET